MSEHYEVVLKKVEQTNLTTGETEEAWRASVYGESFDHHSQAATPQAALRNVADYWAKVERELRQ